MGSRRADTVPPTAKMTDLMTTPVRVVVAEDDVLLREGLAACSNARVSTSWSRPATARSC